MAADKIGSYVKLAGIIILAVVLLFIVTWAGIVKCGSIPYWCEVYDSVLGGPRVLIVYGDAGLGDPEALKLALQNPENTAAQTVDLAQIDQISSGNLKDYKLVIVEHARKISFEQLNMFMDYVNTGGGRLVWVGDAGVERSDDEVQNLADVNELFKYGNNPWVRAKDLGLEGYKVIQFGEDLLGLTYIGNYCEEKTCASGTFSVGILKTEATNNHPLIYGANPALALHITKDRDLAIVKQFANASNSNIVLTLDQGSVMVGKDNIQIERNIPIIATSGLGERVAYYAYPVEYLLQDNNYSLFVKRMYQGMLGR